MSKATGSTVLFNSVWSKGSSHLYCTSSSSATVFCYWSLFWARAWALSHNSASPFNLLSVLNHFVQQCFAFPLPVLALSSAKPCPRWSRADISLPQAAQNSPTSFPQTSCNTQLMSVQKTSKKVFLEVSVFNSQYFCSFTLNLFRCSPLSLFVLLDICFIFTVSSCLRSALTEIILSYCWWKTNISRFTCFITAFYLNNKKQETFRRKKSICSQSFECARLFHYFRQTRHQLETGS